MKLLYYSWNENSSPDLLAGLEEIGHEIIFFERPGINKLKDEEFENEICEYADIDAIISFNFFPTLSNAAKKLGVVYISWVYDSPHLTLYTDAVFNSCNRIFHFDEAEVNRLKAAGLDNIYHMPLAVNSKRLIDLCAGKTDTDRADDEPYYDISFVGSLYNGDSNLLKNVKYLPDYERGYLDSIIRSQIGIYGLDMVGLSLTDSFYKRLQKYIGINAGDDLWINDKEILRQMIQREITSVERIELLDALSREFKTIVFTTDDCSQISAAENGGYVTYFDRMPKVFNHSKININISLRSIETGIPLRCMDILGAGGFLLSNYQEELVREFEDGRELVVFTDKQDLLDKAEYYLAHEEERRKIALAGRKAVMERFSYKTQLTRIFSIIGS